MRQKKILLWRNVTNASPKIQTELPGAPFKVYGIAGIGSAFSCLHIWRVGAGSIPVSTPTSGTDRPETCSAGRQTPPQSVFATTRWSVVLAAGQRYDRCPGSAGKLCQTYWYPLYAYVRRRGHSPEDAQDLTQEFFAQLLERKSLAKADPNRGRFRSFLLATMNHFLTNAWKRRGQKRGSGRRIAIPGLGRRRRSL